MSGRRREAGTHPLAALWAWTAAPAARAVGLIVLVVAALALAGADWLRPREDYVGFAAAPGFYALLGLGAAVIAMLAAWPLRRSLERREDYYGGDDGDE
ncbi:MAG: hypothetical protein KIS81_10055 [Maricaulaceae bacterium]|nr:hypothetical protein [Maricaulaceae bacterium]